MRRFRALAIILAAVLARRPAQARPARAPETRDVCPGIRLIGPDIHLDEVEKRLVCGDPSSDGWKTVPLNQAESFMKAFLQRRGRHFPKFHAAGDTLEVSVGTATYVTKATASGLDGIFDVGKRRKIVGELLTPAELDKFKSALQFELQSRGYACPKIDVTANAATGEIHADVDPGPIYYVGAIDHPRIPGIDPGVFERFTAFEPFQPLDVRLLSLTSDRLRSQALFLSAYYDIACTTAGVTITQRVVEAPARLVTLGVGADTEGYIRGRARWQHSRIGYRASSVEATAFGSVREQSADALMRYYLRPADRIYLMPRFFARRENEIQYDAAHSQASLSPSWTWDNQDFHVEVQGGPAVDYFNTLRGLGPTDSTFFSFVTHAQVMSHLYEYYQNNPQRGWTASLDTTSRLAGAFSSVSADQIRLEGQNLWNLGHYSPPVAILAIRGWIGTTWVGSNADPFSALPPTMRFFLGGDADLRGADRKQLPNDGTGFLTAAYQGLELRAGDILPYGLQPLVFVDGALAGQRDFRLDKPVYWDPGAGLRWALPFGAIRATIARGFVWSRNAPVPGGFPRWQFFFSLGQEF